MILVDEGSYLGTKIERTGFILKKTALARINDYQKRLSNLGPWYESLFKDLIIDNFDMHEACITAKKLFRRDAKFVAIDGTEYSRPLFDMIIFYAGAYSSEGTLTFSEDKIQISYKDRFMHQGKDVSSCVPIYTNKVPEIDQTFFNKSQGQVDTRRPITEEVILNNTNIANFLMTFSEFFLAYQLAASKNYDIILLDRSLSNTYSSLIYDTSIRGLWNTNCSLLGFDIDGIPIDSNDLRISRHNVINQKLDLPPRRGDYLRYAILVELQRDGEGSRNGMDLQGICQNLKLGNDVKIINRIEKYIKRWVDEGVITKTGDGNYRLVYRYQITWQRIKQLVTIVGKQLFHGTDDPFVIQKNSKSEEYITTLDLAFLTLFSLYMLIEECWKNKIVLVGMTKDTAAHDFKNHVMPICLNNDIWSKELRITQNEIDQIPNTDRMFLQSISISNHDRIKVPWSLIEYDSAFVMAIPDLKKRKGYVSGAIKNKIIPTRMFVRSFIQLGQAKSNSIFRSNVLAIDRLVVPDYDLSSGNLFDFKHDYSGEEMLSFILFRNNRIRNELQNLLIPILTVMSAPSIAEAFGHNKPLYIADKVAKWHNEEFRKIVDSTGSTILCDKSLRNFVFYMSSFREKRETFERSRKV